MCQMSRLPYPLMDEGLIEEEDTLSSNADLTTTAAHRVGLYRLQIPEEFVSLGQICEEILCHRSVMSDAGVISPKFHQFIECGQTAFVSGRCAATPQCIRTSPFTLDLTNL